MKRIELTLLAGLLLFFGSVTLRAQDTAATSQAGASEQDTTEISARELADRLIAYAETFLGTPYRYGANGPKRFDCTAYTRYVYSHFGYHNLSRSSKGQAKDGRPVDISDLHNLQKGDILVIGSRRNPKVVGHAAIFIELDSTGRDPKFIHAAVSGVRYSTMLTESYYSNRILGARRILPDFEEQEVTFDTTATYTVDPNEQMRIAPDSLVLSDADRRIVLFENGKWAYVEPDGKLRIPEKGGRIVLASDGNWAAAREAMVRVPESALEPEQPPVPDTKVDGTSAVDTTAATGTQNNASEKVYHTIRSGDTLSKIAKLHHTTVNRLCDLNGITPTTILRVGRKLRVK